MSRNGYLTGLKAKKTDDGVGSAWASWPPAKSDHPLMLKDGTTPSDVSARGPMFTVGDWAVCRMPHYVMVMVSKDGRLAASWNLIYAYEKSDDAILVTRRSDNYGAPHIMNYITGGTATDGMPATLLPEWYESSTSQYLSPFHDGLARMNIIRNGKKMTVWIRRSDGTPLPLMKWVDGKLASDPDTILDSTDDFSEGFGVASRLNSNKIPEYNWYDTAGIPLIKGEWLKQADHFTGGWGGMRRKDGMWNFVDTTGRILSDTWFYGIGSFSEDGGPAWVMPRPKTKVNGQWKVLRGRTADGGADLSDKALKVASVSRFSCGLSIVSVDNPGNRGYTKCYVDEEVRNVGPATFKDADGFSKNFMDGKWATVMGSIGGGGISPHGLDEKNLMDRNGMLMFIPDAPRGGWPIQIELLPGGRKGYGSPGTHLVRILSKAKIPFIFFISPDYGSADEIGVQMLSKNREPLEGTDGKIEIRPLMNRLDGKGSRGFAAMDSRGTLHPICSLDGKWEK